jgi:hypothetical protein
MQYAIPQFITVEDRVIGPLTVRQFIFLVIGGVSLVIFWALADLGLFIFLAFFTVIITVAFAFVKVNGRPFQIFLTSVTQFFSKPRLRTWYREPAIERIKAKTKKLRMDELQKAEEMALPEGKRLVKSRLRELSNILDQEMTAALLSGQEETGEPQL